MSASFFEPISPAFFAVPLDLGSSLEVDSFLLLGFSLGVPTLLDLSCPRATPSDPEYWSSSGEQEAENLKMHFRFVKGFLGVLTMCGILV